MFSKSARRWRKGDGDMTKSERNHRMNVLTGDMIATREEAWKIERELIAAPNERRAQRAASLHAAADGYRDEFNRLANEG